MIVIQGSVRVRAEDVERVRAVAHWLVPATRDDPGCLHYAYAHDMFDPTLIHIIQRWEDETALQAHLSSPHAVRLSEFLRKIQLSELLVKSYAASCEDILMGG